VSGAASGAERHGEAFDNVPEELRCRPQWVVHKDKEPFIPGTSRRASSTDLMSWRSFEEAVAALKTGRFDGVGFVFSTADPYTGIDLDHCRDPETGEIDREAQEIIDALDGYTEISPSGRGVHIIVRGKVEKGRKCGWIEAYSSERFFTVTGRTL
jgi:putative DNA primase/helicase